MEKTEMIRKVKNYLFQFNNKENNKKILEALKKVDRIDFVENNKQLAYEDEAIPIGYGQTISQPSTVARMLSLLELKKTDKVLEIGTGSLWNAALLAYLTKKVITIEIVEQLIKKAKEKIKNIEIKNIEIKKENFMKIKGKFDKIIFTAGILRGDEYIIEDFAKKHLKERGVLVCPYRAGPLIVIKKIKNKIKKEYTPEEYFFVPLII